MPLTLCYRAEVLLLGANIGRAWQVLTDLDAYPAWNPFTVSVRSTLQPGAPVVMRVRLGPWGTISQTETVVEAAPYRLVWGLDGLPRWLLWARREQTLAEESGGVRYVTVDRIGGLLSPLVALLYGRALREGFAAMAEALAARVGSSA